MEEELTEEMAIIKDVGVGMRDNRQPCLWFNVKTLDGLEALQIFRWDSASQVILDYGVYDVKSLSGMPCAVVRQGGMMRYSRAVIG